MVKFALSYPQIKITPQLRGYFKMKSIAYRVFLF